MKERFNIEGMTCQACQAHVQRACDKLDGVIETSLIAVE